MARAIELARPHFTHPNPRVGAVVVGSDGRVLGEGAHLGPGAAHAEAIALAQAGEAATGATVYSTLEPCTVHGRTPPCVDALISAGVARVVIGAMDPDKRVSGRGIAALRQAGVKVVEGVMAEESLAIDPAYFRHRTTGMPLVTLKYGMTLDGSVAAEDGSSRWITSDEARADAHRLRAGVDAVVIGSGTLVADNPLLDVRLGDPHVHQPRPVIVTGRGELPMGARIWQREPLVVSVTERPIGSGRLVLVEGFGGRPDPEAACLALADLGFLDILLEGGPTLAGEWWRKGVVTRGVVYLGPKIGGGEGRSPLTGAFPTIEDAEVVSISGVRSLGDGARIDFERG